MWSIVGFWISKGNPFPAHQTQDQGLWRFSRHQEDQELEHRHWWHPGCSQHWTKHHRLASPDWRWFRWDRGMKTFWRFQLPQPRTCDTSDRKPPRRSKTWKIRILFSVDGDWVNVVMEPSQSNDLTLHLSFLCIQMRLLAGCRNLKLDNLDQEFREQSSGKRKLSQTDKPCKYFDLNFIFLLISNMAHQRQGFDCHICWIEFTWWVETSTDKQMMEAFYWVSCHDDTQWLFSWNMRNWSSANHNNNADDQPQNIVIRWTHWGDHFLQLAVSCLAIGGK